MLLLCFFSFFVKKLLPQGQLPVTTQLCFRITANPLPGCSLPVALLALFCSRKFCTGCIRYLFPIKR